MLCSFYYFERAFDWGWQFEPAKSFFVAKGWSDGFLLIFTVIKIHGGFWDSLVYRRDRDGLRNWGFPTP